MNAEVKAKWVTALLSGEYKQGKGWLRSRNEEFCCLGVLCDLASKEGVGDWNLSADKTGISIYRYIADDQPNGAELPLPVQRWAGLDESDPTIPMNYAAEIAGFPTEDDTDRLLETTLAAVNDAKASFVQIAKLIEETL
jgi:hypothetical protein